MLFPSWRLEVPDCNVVNVIHFQELAVSGRRQEESYRGCVLMEGGVLDEDISPRQGYAIRPQKRADELLAASSSACAASPLLPREQYVTT